MALATNKIVGKEILFVNFYLKMEGVILFDVIWVFFSRMKNLDLPITAQSAGFHAPSFELEPPTSLDAHNPNGDDE